MKNLLLEDSQKLEPDYFYPLECADGYRLVGSNGRFNPRLLFKSLEEAERAMRKTEPYETCSDGGCTR